jgi:hypothetical protein
MVLILSGSSKKDAVGRFEALLECDVAGGSSVSVFM